MVLDDDAWYKEFIRQMKFDILNEIGIEGPMDCLWNRKFSVCVQDVGAALKMTASQILNIFEWGVNRATRSEIKESTIGGLRAREKLVKVMIQNIGK